MLNISLRQARAADYESVCCLLAEADAHHREAVPHVFQAAEGPARERDYYMSILEDDSSAVFLAEADGQAVGVIHVLARESPPIPIMVARRYAVVDSLVVSQRFRRVGIGTRLMERAHAWVTARGIDTVELTVWEFNAGAMAFYEQLGYVTDRRHMTTRLPHQSP